VGENQLQHGNLVPALAGCQPRPDGEILVAAFTEDFVLTAALREQLTDVDPRDIGPDDVLDPRVAKAHRDSIDARLKHAGPLEWYRLDPLKGLYSLEAPPRNVKRTFRNQDDLAAFRWRFKTDGNLLVETGPETPQVPDKSPAQDRDRPRR
jgi:hypothetical protein